MGRRPDHFSRRARTEDYPARSVYKLEEIDRRLRLVRPATRVLDLGAAPGSWSLYLARAVGPAGSVVAVDPRGIDVALPPNVTVVRGEAEAVRDRMAALGPFDLVVSDMAPSTTGDRLGDQHRSFDLFRSAASIARDVGAPGSAFLAKLFHGPSFEEARALLRETYGSVRVMRPRATRSESYEIYLAGLDKGLGDPGEASGRRR